VAPEEEAMSVLSIWTVYFDPKDHPEKYVVKRWEVGDGPDPRPTDDIFVSDSLPELRALIPPGMTMMGRFGDDDPCIVEVWL
jgi:hypothetical protein